MPALEFILPGDPETLTGGYLYDRRIVDGLRALGWRVRVHALDASFPVPDAAALAQAEAILASLPGGRLLVVDGLALGGMPELVEAAAARFRLVALIHHPLAQETGIDRARAAALYAAEKRALASVQRVLVTSHATAAALRDYQVPGERIGVVLPGTEVRRLAVPASGSVLQLLCVATLTPRKGHDVLLHALAQLRNRSWRLCCVGSLERSPATASALRRQIEALGLQQRVLLLGEVDEGTLQACYQTADVFVLASHMEGYGMALAEALAHGLPVISTRSGAIPQTVPPQAGLLVPAGDSAALSVALARVLDDSELRARLAAGARREGAQLPDWAAASRNFARELASVRACPQGNPGLAVNSRRATGRRLR